VRAIVVCVNYADILAITLPRNARHFEEVLVVSTPQDTATASTVNSVPNAKLYCTEAFTRYGAKFNKGLALEEGFDALGRDGWICIHDADIVLPDVWDGVEGITPGKLYSAPRRICTDPKAFRPQPWATFPPTRDIVFPGYFQLFHANDLALLPLPWYDVTFKHAGGGDGFFQSRWPKERKVRLPFDVLHLGPRDTNWFGRGNDEDMRAFRAADWRRRGQGFRPLIHGRTHSCIWLASDYAEHVEVPGHEPRVWVHGLGD